MLRANASRSSSDTDRRAPSSSPVAASTVDSGDASEPEGMSSIHIYSKVALLR